MLQIVKTVLRKFWKIGCMNYGVSCGDSLLRNMDYTVNIILLESWRNCWDIVLRIKTLKFEIAVKIYGVNCEIS